MKRTHTLIAILFAMTLAPFVAGAITNNNCKNINKAKQIYNPQEVKKKHHEAILLVTFGSTHKEAHETFRKIRSSFAKAFPDKDIYMAFTSTICIKRWADKTGQKYETPDMCLSKIARENYNKIYVQSLHIIPGYEYSLIVNRYVPQFKKDYPQIPILVSEPLLSDNKDIQTVGDILYNQYKHKLQRGEYLVLMGHGNDTNDYPHANSKYDQLNEYLQTLNKGIMIGTVDYTKLLFSSVLQYLEMTANKGAAINLAPLMSIAGDHAKNDMAGNYIPGKPIEEQSWAVQLKKRGYKTHCILEGLAENEQIIQVWINHLKDKM